MWRFLVDEDMPRSTAVMLRAAGHQADDVRDVGLRGHADTDVFAFAQAHGAALVTADTGFANIVRFPLGTHSGIIVLRVPNELPTRLVNQELINALAALDGSELGGTLVIVEVGRIRVRQPRPERGARANRA